MASSDEIGHKLYVVISQKVETVPGKSAWAGIGWTQENEKGRGLFVEHHGSDKIKLQNDIISSLEFMKTKRSLQYGDIEHEIIGIECKDDPVCAVVLAVFQP
jgi:arginine decarboxylase